MEFVIVIGIISLIASLSFFGLQQSKDEENVRAAAKQLVSELNTMQSKVNNGFPSSTTVINQSQPQAPTLAMVGLTSSGNTVPLKEKTITNYLLDQTLIDLPKGTKISVYDRTPPATEETLVTTQWDCLPNDLSCSKGIYICLLHRSYTQINDERCPCTSFACRLNGPGSFANFNSGRVRIVISNLDETVSRAVYVEGNGLHISRIYEAKN